MNAQVSICIPLYKPSRKYLTALADSLAKQTYLSFEVVISDDGDSEDMVKQLFRGLNFNYHKTAGSKGIFSNLNNAIKHSKGELVQILCQDDVCEPDYILEMVKLMSLFTKAFFGYTQCDNIDENSLVIRSQSDSGYGVIKQSDAYNYFLAYGCLPGNLSTVMIRREAFGLVGLFDENLKYASDFDFWLRLASIGDLAISFKSSINIRLHSMQASTQLSNEIYVHDMGVVITKLFTLSSLSKWTKILFINKFYGCYILVRLLKEIHQTGSLISLRTMLYLIKRPLSIPLIILIMPFRSSAIFDLKKNFPFPKPLFQ